MIYRLIRQDQLSRGKSYIHRASISIKALIPKKQTSLLWHYLLIMANLHQDYLISLCFSMVIYNTSE
jgi:hypothetical protein